MNDYDDSPAPMDRSRAEQWQREAAQRFDAMGLEEDLGLRTYLTRDYPALIVTSTRTQGWVELTPHAEGAELGVRFGALSGGPEPATPGQALGITDAQTKALRTRILAEVMYPSLQAVRRTDPQFPGPPGPGYEHLSFEDRSRGWFTAADQLRQRLDEIWGTQVVTRWRTTGLNKDYELGFSAYDGPQAANVELLSRANGSGTSFDLDGQIWSSLAQPGPAPAPGIAEHDLDSVRTQLFEEVMIPARDAVVAEKRRIDDWDPLDHAVAVPVAVATDYLRLPLGPPHRDGATLDSPGEPSPSLPAGDITSGTRQPAAVHPAAPTGTPNPPATATPSPSDESALARSTRLARTAHPTGGPSPITRSGPGW